MKNIKTTLSLLFTALFIWLSITPAFAAPKQTPYNFLIKCGYSPEYLDNLSDDMIIYICEQIGDNTVIEVETKNLYLDENGNFNPIETIGGISESDLIISMTIAHIHKANTNQTTGCIVGAEWLWTNKNVYRGKDALSLNWDASLFYQASFLSQDMYRSSLSSNSIVSKEYTKPTESSQGGLGFYTRLDKSLSYYPAGAFVAVLYTTSTLYDNNGNNNLGTAINLNYVHSKFANIGLSFSVGPVGVSINPGSNYDSLSDTIEFRYSR
jgi:hypothetical protein